MPRSWAAAQNGSYPNANTGGQLAPLPRHRSSHAFALDALKLGDRRGNVFEGNQTERNQTLEIVAAIVSSPIVEGTRAGVAELSIGAPKQRHPRRGVDPFGGDAIAILILDALRRIVNRFGRVVQTALHEFRHLVCGNSRTEKSGQWRWRNILAGKILAGLAFEFDRARRSIAKAGIETFRPHFWRLDEVGVRRDQWFIGHHTFLLACDSNSYRANS
jgi:hypothetical protein